MCLPKTWTDAFYSSSCMLTDSSSSIHSSNSRCSLLVLIQRKSSWFATYFYWQHFNYMFTSIDIHDLDIWSEGVKPPVLNYCFIIISCVLITVSYKCFDHKIIFQHYIQQQKYLSSKFEVVWFIMSSYFLLGTIFHMISCEMWCLVVVYKMTSI